jgi:hypothetical protein
MVRGAAGQRPQRVVEMLHCSSCCCEGAMSRGQASLLSTGLIAPRKVWLSVQATCVVTCHLRQLLFAVELRAIMPYMNKDGSDTWCFPQVSIFEQLFKARWCMEKVHRAMLLGTPSKSSVS